MQRLLHFLETWALAVQSRYHVNPAVFIALNVICAPLFYYSIYRTVRAATQRKSRDVRFWGTVFMAVSIVPYVYVLIFGRHLPLWVVMVIVALVAHGVVVLVRRVRGAQASANAAS
jgi:hypothetical protein